MYIWLVLILQHLGRVLRIVGLSMDMRDSTVMIAILGSAWVASFLIKKFSMDAVRLAVLRTR
jgi:hypothetical protein